MKCKSLFKSVFVSLILFLMCLANLPAQITIKNIDWQTSKGRGTKRKPFISVKDITLKQDIKTNEKLRVLISIRNDSDKDIEGLVLRYSLNFRIIKLNSKDDYFIWSVPFRIEELRVSKIKALSSHSVKIINTNLNNELKKFKNSGFWVDALAVKIMIEPRKGNDLTKNIRQSVISVKY